MPTNLILRTSISPYGDFTKGSVLSQAELDSNFIGLKGEVIYTAQTIGNTVTLKKYNGNDLSFNVGSGSGGGNQWYIPENTTVTVTENYQGFIYGDLFVDGNLQLDAGGQFVVLNGNVYLGSGGTITGSGDFYNIDLPTFDTFITGGTYNSITSEITFTNNSGNTFVVTGITTGGSGSTGPISVSGTTLYSNNPATSNFSDSYSIFLSQNAGFQATGASNSNFLGFQAGYQATNASDSNFLGQRAGRQATNAYRSNFLGYYAGLGATNANDSNFLGLNAGNAATGASYSNFLGYQAGYSATSASYSNFFGQSAGYQATNASQSNFLGQNAGNATTDASSSNFLGPRAGYSATSANNSNFLGSQAGREATNANNSNFLGQNAGYAATSANNSNFLGYFAGNAATDASSSNFLGYQAGYSATSANNSNFLGANAGYQANDAYNSNFLGQNAGYQATNASLSNFFGYLVGRSFTGNNLGSNNIIIGTNITLPNATANAINIGGVLFGTETYYNVAGNPLTATTANGRIGIRVVTPSSTLDVSGTTGYNQFRLRTTYTPTSSGDTNGNIGDIAWDNTYIYIKTNTGWGRTQLSYGF